MSGQIPDKQKPAVVNVPQPIPKEMDVVPIDGPAGENEGKQSAMLLMLILGISFGILCVVTGVIAILVIASSSGDGSSEVADRDDSEAQSTFSDFQNPIAKSSPFQPNEKKRNNSPPPQELVVDSLISAKQALNSNSTQLKEKALDWFIKNTIPRSDVNQIVRRLEKLLDNYNRSVRRKSFNLLLKYGNSSHSPAIVNVAERNRLDEKKFRDWFQKHPGPKDSDMLIKMMNNSRTYAQMAVNVLRDQGPGKSESKLLAHFNTKTGHVRDRCREVLSSWKTDPKKIANQCISDMSDSDKSRTSAIQWLQKNEPIQELKGAAHRQSDRDPVRQESDQLPS